MKQRDTGERSRGRWRQHAAAAVIAAAMVMVAVSALARALPTYTALTDADRTVIPMEYDPPLMPWPVVRISINGQPPLPFVVDSGTGENALMFSRQAAEALKLPRTGQERKDAHGRVYIYVVSVDKMEIMAAPGQRSVSLAHFQAIATDLPMTVDTHTGPPIAGMLCAPILSFFTADFDFARKTLTLVTKPHEPIRDPKAITVPLELPGVARRDWRVYARAKFEDGVEFPWLVDTGGMSVSVPSRMSGYLGEHAVASGTTQRIGFRDNLQVRGEQVTDYVVPVRTLGLDEPTVEVTIEPDTAAKPTYIMGLDLLARFRVIIDYRNKQMTLYRASDYAERARPPGTTGITLGGNFDGKYVISSIAEGSPAAKALLLPLDRIISVDGHELASMPPNVARDWLNGRADTPVEVLVERGSGDQPPRRLAFHFRRALPYQPAAPPSTINRQPSTAIDSPPPGAPQ